MKTVAAVAVTIATLALAGCSSAAPALTDDQLAHEYVQLVFGVRLEDQPGGVGNTPEIVGVANKNCATMRLAQGMGLLSTESGAPGNADWVHRTQQEALKSQGVTARQTFDALSVSAKYKCPEFADSLELFEAVDGIN